jgi:hypothetical protein
VLFAVFIERVRSYFMIISLVMAQAQPKHFEEISASSKKVFCIA